jgi:hypothetical protein
VTVVTVQLVSSPTVDLPVGGIWTIDVSVYDVDGGLVVTDVPVVTVTPPGGVDVPVVPTVTSLGYYRASVLVTTAGRYLARVVTAAHGAADLAAYVTAVRAGIGMPSAEQFRAYASEDFGSYEDDEIEATIAAEAAAQRRVCRVGAVIPDDLWEALLRRVRVSLSRRGQPVLVTVDSDGTNTFLPARDPEVRRLEAPHRKLVMG